MTVAFVGKANIQRIGQKAAIDQSRQQGRVLSQRPRRQRALRV